MNIVIVIGIIVIAILRHVLKPSMNEDKSLAPRIPRGMEEVFPEIPVINQPVYDSTVVKPYTQKENYTRSYEPGDLVDSQELRDVNANMDTLSIEEIHRRMEPYNKKERYAKSFKRREVADTVTLQQAADTNRDIDTTSIEDIRKGIIWSEILNRKYQ